MKAKEEIKTLKKRSKEYMKMLDSIADVVADKATPLAKELAIRDIKFPSKTDSSYKSRLERHYDNLFAAYERQQNDVAQPADFNLEKPNFEAAERMHRALSRVKGGGYATHRQWAVLKEIEAYEKFLECKEKIISPGGIIKTTRVVQSTQTTTSPSVPPPEKRIFESSEDRRQREYEECMSAARKTGGLFSRITDEEREACARLQGLGQLGIFASLEDQIRALSKQCGYDEHALRVTFMNKAWLESAGLTPSSRRRDEKRRNFNMIRMQAKRRWNDVDDRGIVNTPAKGLELARDMVRLTRIFTDRNVQKESDLLAAELRGQGLGDKLSKGVARAIISDAVVPVISKKARVGIAKVAAAQVADKSAPKPTEFLNAILEGGLWAKKKMQGRDVDAEIEQILADVRAINPQVAGSALEAARLLARKIVATTPIPLTQRMREQVAGAIAQKAAKIELERAAQAPPKKPVTKGGNFLRLAAVAGSLYLALKG
jgi:hypothetical protein